MSAVRLLPLVLAACSTSITALQEPGPIQTESEVTGEGLTVRDETVVLDGRQGVVGIDVGTDQILVDTDGTDLGIEAGAVVVGRFDGGYLRRVVEVVEQGDRVVLRTERADLSDAILHGDYHVSAAVAERAATTWDLGGRVLYSGDLWSNQENDFVGVDVFIADGAQLTVNPEFDFDIELFNGNWIDAGFQADVDLDYNADFVVDVAGAYGDAIEASILTRDIDFDFDLGPVPVTGRATIEIIAGVQGDFEGTGQGTIHTEAFAIASVGAGYNDDGWYFDKDAAIDGDIGFRNGFEQTGYARAWLRARMTIDLYDAAGAQVELNPWLEVNTCDPLGVDVDGGVDGNHRYYFEALGWFDFDSGVRDLDFGPWDIYSLECDGGF